MEIKNDLFLRACRREKTERTPIWIMRQAGRYLPEYRKIREKYDFITMVKTPELAAEVTIQPVEIIGVDAAIIFSDILVIPEAMGLPYKMEEKVGPRFDEKIETENDIEKLSTENIEEKLSYVFEAVKLTKKELNGRVPLIGFAGSPWTLMTYMIEGGGTKNFKKAKTFIYNNPQAARKLLDKISQAVIKYISEKIKSGIDAYQIFDSWGGVLSKRDYLEFSLPYIKKIIETVNSNFDVPSIVFSKGANHSFEEIAQTGASVIGVDWTAQLSDVRKRVAGAVAIQGNLDPILLFANEQKLASEVENTLADYGKGDGHIFNLGHGILPEVEPAKAKLLVDLVKEKSKKYHE